MVKTTKDYAHKTHQGYNHRLVVIDWSPVYYCRKCKRIVLPEEVNS